MAKLLFGMSQSLDGYVDDAPGTLGMPPPGPALFRHFIEIVAGNAGAIYGRRIYEVMRYWDGERPEWDVAEREFAVAWVPIVTPRLIAVHRRERASKQVALAVLH